MDEYSESNNSSSDLTINKIKCHKVLSLGQYLYIGFGVTVALVILVNWIVTIEKHVFTCAECRRFKWEYRWKGGLLWQSEQGTRCSEWIAKHDKMRHPHSWVRGENVWLTSVTGHIRGAGSRDYQSYIWRISPDDQLAVYQRSIDADSFNHNRALFREFAKCQKGNPCEDVLISSIRPLIQSVSASKENGEAASSEHAQERP